MNALPAVQRTFAHLPTSGPQADALRAQVAQALLARWTVPMPRLLQSDYYRYQIVQQRSFLTLLG